MLSVPRLEILKEAQIKSIFSLRWMTEKNFGSREMDIVRAPPIALVGTVRRNAHFYFNKQNRSEFKSWIFLILARDSVLGNKREEFEKSQM